MSHFFMPGDSNWKSPVVSPRLKSAYVSLSSSGMRSGSSSPEALRIAAGTRGLSFPNSATHSFSTVSVFNPKKSIFKRPTGSTKWPSYCVVKSLSPVSAPRSPLPFFPPFSGVGMTGSVSTMGSREMMTPQAWTPGWRMHPSSLAARAISVWTMGSGELNDATSSGEKSLFGAPCLSVGEVADLKETFGVLGT